MLPHAIPMVLPRDVVQVARNRGLGRCQEKIAAEFGIHPIALSNSLKKTDLEEGLRPGVTSTQSAELRPAVVVLIKRETYHRTRSQVALGRFTPSNSRA